MMVPSLVPMICRSKNNRERITDTITQVTSNAILIFPKFFPVISVIAFTKASHEFMITFAITDKEIPKPRMAMPISTIKSCMM